MTFAIDGGEAVESLAFTGDVLAFVSTRAFAPGAPLALVGGGIRFEAKTIGSKKREDGRFEVRVRPINLRRADRERLFG